MHRLFLRSGVFFVLMNSVNFSRDGNVTERIFIPKTAKLYCSKLDEEHQGIADYINGVSAQIEKGERIAPRQVLDGMLDLLSMHFRHEEAEMQRLGYPELLRHSAHHAEIIATLKAAWANSPSDGQVDEGWIGRLFSMLIDDILRADLGFKAFIEERGLSDSNGMSG